MSEPKYNTLGAYPQAATKRDAVGIGGLEARIDEIEQITSNIYEHLCALQGKLYPPRPQAIQGQMTDNAVPASIENSLNRIINHLQAVRNLSSELLNG